RLEPSKSQRDAFVEFKQNIENVYKGLAEEVKQRRDEYDLHAAGEPSVMAKFKIALLKPAPFKGQKQGIVPPLGLANQALKLLLDMKKEHIEQLKDEERYEFASWQVRLLLSTGRIREVRELFRDDADNPARATLQGILGPAFDQYEAIL